jgi:hypothetical protein
MAIVEATRGLKEARGEYDFAVDGGAVGTITLRAAPSDSNGNDIPSGSIIMGGYIEVDTVLTSGGAATVAVNSEGAGDLATAALLNAAPWSTATGRKAITPVMTVGTSVKTTARRNLAITIAAAALTAGKFRVVVWYR